MLCVEAAGAVERESHCAPALAPIPVDAGAVLRQIPRDPRHASKTDEPALRRRLGVGVADGG